MSRKAQTPAILKEIEAQMTGQMSLKMNLKTPLKILELLLFNPSITIPELAQKIDKPRSKTKRAVHRLQQLGYLKRIDPDKGGYWKVVVKKDEK